MADEQDLPIPSGGLPVAASAASVTVPLKHIGRPAIRPSHRMIPGAYHHRVAFAKAGSTGRIVHGSRGSRVHGGLGSTHLQGALYSRLSSLRPGLSRPHVYSPPGPGASTRLNTARAVHVPRRIQHMHQG